MSFKLNKHIYTILSQTLYITCCFVILFFRLHTFSLSMWCLLEANTNDIDVCERKRKKIVFIIHFSISTLTNLRFYISDVVLNITIMLFIIIPLLIVYISYKLYQHFYPSPNIDPQGKYVLISGCDTGFGHILAIELDKQGFNIFASVYNEENKNSLKNKLSERATVFCLDITQPTQIDAAYEIVKEKTNTLHALVNNAGIDQDGLIDWITLDFMRNMMEVNFFGHVAMTKKFLPLLITKRGSRVVNLCSVAGYLVAPSMSSYCASKFAFESFSDCLRREMHPWGLHVSIIEPSYMRTPIIEGHVQTMQKIWDGLSTDVKIDGEKIILRI